jgi:glycosyltransferase involved in cell wall biosynthesis
MPCQPPIVTVSVWNDFWSQHLVNGLVQHSFSVIHHTTASQKTACFAFDRNILATMLNHLVFRGLIQQRTGFSWSKTLVDLKSARLASHSDVFWGWSGCSLRGLQTAKACGRLAILERGSTHCVWQKERVASEYKRLGINISDLPSNKEISYDLEEYEIADVICVPSRFVLNTFLEKQISEKKLYLNPYGVDFAFWSQCQPANRQLKPFTFIWVAGLTPRKGIAILLEAWRKAELRDARLVLIGGISPTIQHLLTALPRNLEIHQYLNHREIRNLMSRSHCYILPSFEEGMARSVLEAAAAGLPVIVTEETGATDILKDGRDGWVIPSGDSDALAEVLRQSASDPVMASTRGRSAQEAVRSYTWDAYGDRAAAFLHNVLA